MKYLNHSLFIFLVSFLSFWLSTITIAQTNASDFTTGYRYDLTGRLTGTIQADPDAGGPRKFLATRNTYNTYGQLEKIEQGSLSSWPSETLDPSQWGTYGFTVLKAQTNTYDSYGRKVTELFSNGSGSSFALTQYSYDVANRVECVAQRMNRTVYSSIITTLPSACAPYIRGSGSEDFGNDRITKTSYTYYSEILQIKKAVGTTIEQNYVTNTYKGNKKGLLESSTDANGNLTFMTYDNLGRMKEQHFPSLTTKGQYSNTDYESYTYDNNGNRQTLKKRDGKIISFYYDALNRVYLKDAPGSEPDVYSMYNNHGLQTYARFGSTTGAGITNNFNGFGQLISTTINMSGSNRTLSYSYDDNGNRTKVTHPDVCLFWLRLRRNQSAKKYW